MAEENTYKSLCDAVDYYRIQTGKRPEVIKISEGNFKKLKDEAEKFGWLIFRNSKLFPCSIYGVPIEVVNG